MGRKRASKRRSRKGFGRWLASWQGGRKDACLFFLLFPCVCAYYVVGLLPPSSYHATAPSIR
jgi:hypothetical protein